MKEKVNFMKGKMHIFLLFTLTSIFTLWQGVDLFALDQTDKYIITEDNNKFAFDLYSRLKNDEGNLFFSPFSISTALAMTYAGAKGNTQTEMARTLHFSLDQEERLHQAFAALAQELQVDAARSGYELSIANALWGQEGYKFYPAFIDITKIYYEAGFKQVDFLKNTEGARQAINHWVAEKTNNKITELIQSGVLNELSRLVLTNAIYFKGKWASQFKKEFTTQQKFSLLTGEKIEVPMMNQEKDFWYFENESVQILEMPYENEKLAMVILLPRGSSSIKDLENSLSFEGVMGWLAGLRKKEAIVFIPKFKMTCGFLLNDALEALGIKEAFSLKADFSGMTPDPVGLFISRVIHKAFVDVDEEGTEAAAATGVVMVKQAISAPESKPVFRADRPFIFLIRDAQTGSILFMGRVMDPRT